METFYNLFENFGSVIGILITLITFWSIISKKPRERFWNMFLQKSKEANKELEDSVDSLIKENEKSKDRDLVSLRHSITTIYEEYKENKAFPVHVKEDLFSLLQEYDNLGGNSYVHAIVDEMKTWKVI